MCIKKCIGLLFILLMFSLQACDSTQQYDVYAVNSTNEKIKLEYKSLNNPLGGIKQVVYINPSQRKKIISTLNIDKGEGWSKPTHEDCNLVAEYVSAYIQDDKPSSIKWCSDDIQFSTTDVGQGEFTIEYTNESF